MTSTLAGMKMLFKPLRENPHDSKRQILESFSNTINFIDSQCCMNKLPTISNEKGIHRQSQSRWHRANRGLDDCSIIPFFTMILRWYWSAGSREWRKFLIEDVRPFDDRMSNMLKKWQEREKDRLFALRLELLINARPQWRDGFHARFLSSFLLRSSTEWCHQKLERQSCFLIPSSDTGLISDRWC
jgi:hypothetical protein